MNLFLGRTTEAELILKEIGSSERSRAALQGDPGVGKTTLVNYIKQQVNRAADRPVEVTRGSASLENRHTRTAGRQRSRCP